jgi:hypothetical protein
VLRSHQCILRGTVFIGRVAIAKSNKCNLCNVELKMWLSGGSSVPRDRSATSLKFPSRLFSHQAMLERIYITRVFPFSPTLTRIARSSIILLSIISYLSNGYNIQKRETNTKASELIQRWQPMESLKLNNSPNIYSLSHINLKKSIALHITDVSRLSFHLPRQRICPYTLTRGSVNGMDCYINPQVQIILSL